MNHVYAIAVVGAGVLLISSVGIPIRQEKEKGPEKSKKYTFANDVAPIIKTYCLSCHGSDSDSPSELYMDDYETLMKGGKHGVPVVAGKPDQSNMYVKLLPEPPFGRQMPRGRKRITPEAVQVIHDWIQQGAMKE